MTYSWKALPLPGMAALRDEVGNNIGLVQRVSDFMLAYVCADERGPVGFEGIQGRYMLLGAYPSLRAAGRALETEVRLYVKFGKFTNVIMPK